MNILFDGRALADPNSGGVKRVNAGILEALRTQGAAITVATTGASKPKISDEHLGLPTKLLSAAIWLHITSFDRLFNKKSDLLFLPNIGWVGSPKIPYALVVHDLSFLIEPRWFSWKSRLWHRVVGAARQIKNARILFAVSETTKRDLIRLLQIPGERIVVIPLGLDSSFQSPTPASSSIQKKFLLALGANDPRKNAALSKVVAKQTGLELKLIGDASQERVHDEELDQLYAQAAAFLYPSWYEGFGLPLHEAARHGTPCIASTAGALPETAPEGTIFASPSKPQHWIEAVHTILNHPSMHRTKTGINSWNPAAQIIIHHLARLPNPPHQI
jgi:glycosyltransferase involved in cell wall biosynthesis